MSAFSIAWSFLKEEDKKPNLFDYGSSYEEKPKKKKKYLSQPHQIALPEDIPHHMREKEEAQPMEEREKGAGKMVDPKTGMLKPNLGSVGVKTTPQTQAKGSAEVQAPDKMRSVLMPTPYTPAPGKTGKTAIVPAGPSKGKLVSMALPPEWENRLAVVGSRMFGGQPGLEEDHWNLFDDKIQEWIDEHGMPDAIVSGGAEGADQMAAQWANDNNIPLIEHKPDFKTHGRWNATGERNQQIVDDATHVLAFPSGHPDAGGGTQDTMERAINTGVPLSHHQIENPADTPLMEHDFEGDPKGDWFGEYMSQESPGQFEGVGGRDKGERFTPEEIDAMRAAEEEEGGAERGFDAAWRRRVVGGKRGNPQRMTESSRPKTHINEEGEKVETTGIARRGESKHGTVMHAGLNRSTQPRIKMTPFQEELKEWNDEKKRLEEDIDPKTGKSNISEQWFAAHMANRPVAPEEEERRKTSEQLMDEDLAASAAAGGGAFQDWSGEQPREKATRIPRASRVGRVKTKPDLSSLTPPSDDDEVETGYSMNIAFRLLKGFRHEGFDSEKYYGPNFAGPERPDAQDAYHTFLRESYAQTPPPEWSRDWAAVGDDELEQMSEEAFDEYREWEQHRDHLEYEKEQQEKEQEWNDLLAEANELGIDISQGELDQKDVEGIRRRVEMVRSNKGEPMDLAFRFLKMVLA